MEFDHLPWLLGNLDKPGPRGPDWPQVLHSIHAGMDEQGVEWIDDLPPYPSVERPSLDEAVAGARQLCERVGLIKKDPLTDSGRGGAELTRLDRETRLNLLAPILATGVESALVGQDDAPLVPLLRDAARRTSNASSPWAQQLPGLLPVGVAAIIHWACLDIERAHALIRDFEDYRDLAMQGEAPPDEGGISAELTYDDTTEFYREHRDLLGVEVAASGNRMLREHSPA